MSDPFKLPEPVRMSSDQSYLGYTRDQLRAAQLAAFRAGVEAAARVADKHAVRLEKYDQYFDGYQDAAEEIAAAIRELPGETT